jgi:hypothetical protein
MRIKFSEPVILSPEAATELVEELGQLQLYVTNDLVYLGSFAEIRQAADEGRPTLSPEKRACHEKKSLEILRRAYHGVKAFKRKVVAALQQEARAPARVYHPLALAARVDVALSRMGREVAAAAGLPYLRPLGD